MKLKTYKLFVDLNELYTIKAKSYEEAQDIFCREYIDIQEVEE
jgi:hypothetical protein